ncbi:MAG: hypothetical protein PHD81_02830 [Candidatus Nanoarchaeia archaeon]|nr:hypothetical protein [Candidatus Nanoarchaeia archaeon]MDD5588019.1 hypothetical protein [Candidatus Nanoarchaeia archaeon]
MVYDFFKLVKKQFPGEKGYKIACYKHERYKYEQITLSREDKPLRPLKIEELQEIAEHSLGNLEEIFIACNPNKSLKGVNKKDIVILPGSLKFGQNHFFSINPSGNPVLINLGGNIAISDSKTDKYIKFLYNYYTWLYPNFK